MRANKSFNRMEYLPVKFIPLVAALLALSSLVSTGQPAEAQRVDPDAGFKGFWDTMPQQVAPEEDASLGSLTLTVGDDDVALTLAFDAEITRYHATVAVETVGIQATATRVAASIDQFSLDTDEFTVPSPENVLNGDITVLEGTITQFSLRVVAEEGITTKTYYIDFSRPAAETVPDITIEADPSKYVAGLGILDFTLTREGDTTDSLDVSVRLSQDQPWLSDTVHAATFEAGASETDFYLPDHSFSSDVTQSGDLVAIVAAVDGYDTSGARTVVEVISQEGPAVTVTLEHSEYTFAEDAGQAKVVLVARAVPGLPYVPRFSVAVVSADQSATAGAVEDPLSDYLPVSSQIPLLSSDFQDDEGSLVARKEVSITIHDDNVHESDEQFYLHLGRAPGLSREVLLLDAGGNRCGITCPVPYPVIIEKNDPAPTIAAPDDYLVGWGDLSFNLTRVGDLSESLDVTVDFDQALPWLSTTSYTVTFDAEDAEGTLTLTPDDFSSTMTESGEITATVDGHETGGATVRVHPYDGSPVRVSLGSPDYTFDEGAGTVKLQLVARPGTNLPYVPTFQVGVATAADTAASPEDYGELSTTVSITNADFVMEGGHQVARVDLPITIVDDFTYEGDETFGILLERPDGLSTNVILVDAEGNDCEVACQIPNLVTITENDPPVTILTVGLQHTLTGALTRDDNGRDEYSFDGTGGTQYIIEVKHPLRYVDPDEPASNTQPTQVPGYLVDPSILEITDYLGNQLVGERDEGGFTLRWARAFFTPSTSGTYRIAVGAGAQNRGGLGGYTISVRVDDHADDYRTDQEVDLRAGESITARIDSDVAPEDLGLNEVYWGGRGIEMLDDRDVIRFQISDAGMYTLNLSGQPTGVGIRYVWDRRGNLFADALDDDNQPVSSARYEFDPGTYYVEVGTPYESEGNTGAYTLSLAQVNVLQ